ncbi:ATP-binding protein [Streptomyces sp. NPDC057496]|uniref:ATP-binding protein n=1 Tax=Streptomyces sp. NPDC057496 TaxID=3346149 RepID=UPI0036BC07CF
MGSRRSPEAADLRGGHRPRRGHSANFPTGKTLASWRAEDSTIPEPTQNSLITLEWIGRAENLVIAGPSGTGKSHFTEGPARAAIEKDLRVTWFTLETLAAAIGKSKVDGSTARTVARICRADLIVIDDIGLLPVGEDAAEAFYRIIDAAYERRSIVVTSDIHPSEWDRSFGDRRLCAAIVDRITFRCSLIQTGTESYRLQATCDERSI